MLLYYFELFTETDLEPCQISKIERFKNAINYFRQTLYLRCFTVF